MFPGDFSRDRYFSERKRFAKTCLVLKACSLNKKIGLVKMKLVEEKKLDNSLNIIITDHSKVIAADRWYVKIVCTVILPLADKHFADHGDEEPQLLALIRQRLGDELSMDLVQERNFIDAEVREDVSRKLLVRISENMSGYLSSASFPGRFFATRYEEARKSCLLDMAQSADKDGEDVDEPADFSACFRD